MYFYDKHVYFFHNECVDSSERQKEHKLFSSKLRVSEHLFSLTLKMPRKPASENVICLWRLLNIFANFSNLSLHIGKQCGPEQSELLLEEQSDLGPHCLQK